MRATRRPGPRLVHAFSLVRPRDLVAATASAARAGRTDAAVEWIAGGTDMVPLLREAVRRPSQLVDLQGVVPATIEVEAEAVWIGAGATMADVAEDPAIRARLPVVTEALLASASPQVRNLATIGGNLLQRTRCPYFRDVGVPACNKRAPGSGCAALEGDSRPHAVLGVSTDCVAAHASDLAVALVALDTFVHTAGRSGERRMALADLYRLPSDTPHVETALDTGEVITMIEVRAGAAPRRSHYLKLRDRASFEWALVSAAVALDLAGGEIRDVRVAAGGVGTVPWRLRNVEAGLVGRPWAPATLRQAASRAIEGAVSRPQNAFKLDLLPRVIVRALETIGGPV
jgi:xanthine dehydrogenase YagS FAD-binding subunit